MPSWKKVIVSGSSPHFNEITASGNISGSITSTGSFGRVELGQSNSAPMAVYGNAATAGIRLENYKGYFEVDPHTSTVNITSDKDEIQFQKRIGARYGITGYSTSDLIFYTNSGNTTHATFSPTNGTSFTQNITGSGHLEIAGNISGSAVSTGSFGSLVVADKVQGDLTVVGNVVAEQYIVSSSVTHLTQSFSSGSTLFGDTIDDTHVFTGSLELTGSVQLENSGQVKFKRANGVADPFIDFNSSENFRIFNPTNNEIQFIVNSGEIAVFDSAGLTFNGSKTIKSNSGAGVITLQSGAGVKLQLDGNKISGSINSTGSFGHLLVNGSEVATSPDATDGSQDTISGSAVSTGSFGLVQSGNAKHRVLKGWYNDNTIYDLPSGGDQGIRMAKPTPTSGNSSLPIQFTNYFVEIKRVNNNLRLGAYQGVVEIYDTLGTQNIATFGTSGLTFSMGNISGVANITATGNISGSATSTGSFGKLEVGTNVRLRDGEDSFINGGDFGIGTTTPVARLEVEDNSTTNAMLLKLTSDDHNVYGMVIGNDTFSTTDTNGGQHIVGNTGEYIIRSIGAGSAATIRVGAGTAYNNYSYLEITGSVAEFTTTTISGSITSTGSFGHLMLDGGNFTSASLASAGGISNIVEDTTPQLGGNLDANGNDISGSAILLTTGGAWNRNLDYPFNFINLDAQTSQSFGMLVRGGANAAGGKIFTGMGYDAKEHFNVFGDGSVHIRETLTIGGGIRTAPIGNERMHIHRASANGSFMRFTNTNSGHDDADNSGIIIGQDDSEQAQFMNQEDADMFFGVNKIERLRITTDSKISGSLISTGSFGSLVVADKVQGDLTVVGNVVAEQYIISSSVTHLTQSFSSGSTIFGDTGDDTHQFTGSLDITGSIEMNSLNPSVTLASMPHGGTPVIRFIEGTDFRGGFVKFDGASNVFKIGTHNASDSDASNDIDAITMARGTGIVTIPTSLVSDGNVTAAGYIAGTGTFGSQRANIFNNFNSYIGLVLKRTGSGTGDFLRLTDSSENNKFSVEDDGTTNVAGNILPTADNSSNLGAADKRWSNIYSADLHLSNENTNGNEIDGTTGNWTIQEGEDDLYLLNRKNGKKYKFKLEEVT